MLKTLSEKLGAKFPTTTRGFLRIFLTTSKPCRRTITAAKRKEKEKRKGEKKKYKIENPKDNRINKLNGLPR